MKKFRTRLRKEPKQIFKGMPEQQIKEFLIYGTVETVQMEVEKLEEAGIQYFIVYLDPSDQYNQLELFSQSIIKKLN